MRRLARLALLGVVALSALAGSCFELVRAQDAGDTDELVDVGAAHHAGDAGDVTGWADEGDGNTIMCVEMFKLLLDRGGTTIRDGEIAAGTLVVNPKYANLADVLLRGASLSGQGVTTAVDPGTGRVKLRTDGGAPRSDNGELIDLNLLIKVSIDAAAGELPPVCKDVLLKRLVVSSGAGGGVGDPHLTTLDQLNYDFQAPGVFRLFESENLLVQVFQHKCTPVAHLGSRAPSCYQGVAVSFAGSIARLFITESGAVELTKGSSDLSWLAVHKLKGRSVGYRVFTTVDEATYVDVMLTHWINGYPLLNVALRVSPYFKSANVRGLLGNWNGDKRDDVRNSATLTRLHGASLDDNLFTCADADCDKFSAGPSAKDLNASRLPCDMKLLRQGFSPVSADAIPLQTFSPVLAPLGASARFVRRRTEDDDDGEFAQRIKRRATQLCPAVFDQMRECRQYVTNTTNYIQAVCIGDAVLVGDLSIVDNTKVAYLRDCRRELDARIEANTTTGAETAQLLADRKALGFGDLTFCPGACSGRGACLAAACTCDIGYTGVACDIAV